MKRFLLLIFSLLLVAGLKAQADTLVYKGGEYPVKDMKGGPFPNDSMSVDQSPEFPGGEREYFHFLMANIHYPNAAKEDMIEGTVILRVIIEPNGIITNISVFEQPDKGDVLSKEAIRVVKLMPKWKPGLENGKPVRTELFITVNFKLR